MSTPVLEVVAVGDELVHGRGIDTNSAYISDRLEALGFRAARFAVVGDPMADLVPALADAVARADCVVVTGGLGPTEDDRTRHALAAAAGVELAFHDESWRWIDEWMQARGRRATDDNRRQALVPLGGAALRNRWGTAPGLVMEIGGTPVYALPGVPAEMKAMLGAHVEPALRERFADRLVPAAHRTLKVLGPTEAALGERLAARMAVVDGPVTVGVTAHYGLLSVRIVARDPDPVVADALAQRHSDEVEVELGDDFLYRGDAEPAARVLDELRRAGLDLATAESCTGGIIAAMLTDVAGSSDVYRGGWVTYSNQRKRDDLGVPAALLEEHGAVSEPVVGAMAAGAAAASGARIAVAVSGVAGPGGGTDDKPVGTVCFGLTVDGVSRTWTRRIAPIGRRFVRERSAFEVLGAVLRELLRRPS